MYTVTTPTLTFEVEDNINFYETTRVFLTLNDPNDITVLEKDMTVDDKKTVHVVLTQEETLSLPLGVVTAQINYLYEVGDELRRGATEKVELAVEKNNKNEVVFE